MNDIDNDIIRISEELDVPLKKLYMLSNNRIRYHKRNQRKCYSNYRKVIIHRGRGHKNRVLKVPNEYLKLVQRRILERYLYTLSVSASIFPPYLVWKSEIAGDSDLPSLGLMS